MRFRGLLLFAALFLPSLASAFEVVEDPSFGGSLAQDAIVGGEKVGSNSRVSKMTVQLEASILLSDGTKSEATCSGTLIKRDLVLTAAHCVFNLESKFRVLSIVAKTGNGQTIRAVAWKSHPNYKRVDDLETSLIRPVNDIALLKLSEPVGAGHLLALLPSALMSVGQEEEMVVAGFGQTIPNNGTSSGVLYFAWTDGQMKSVMGGQDHQLEMTGVQPCRGDSGGPLFRAPENSPMVVMGVTSHVKGNCESEGRAISVAHHLSWLRQAALELKSKL